MITQKNKRISDGIVYLARSLGFLATQKEVQKTCTNGANGRVTGTYYRCNISGKDIEEIPCLIKRKKAQPRRRETDALVTGVTVEPLGKGKYCGFEINGNGRFLLGDFTVTHNTRISLDFINFLISQKELPPYVIFSLPNVAMKSVGDEILNYGFEIEVLSPTKGTPKNHPFPDLIVKGEIPNKNVITLVKHDDLRLCIGGLSTLSGRFFFIMDEVHKALNNTLRTNASVQLASLATGVIAMTGTLVVDTNVDKLIPWLKQVVPFEVNKKNFWTAANSMVAKLVNTGIKVYINEVMAEFSWDESEAYIQLVSPAIGGVNSSTTAGELKKAEKICYQACTRMMVKQIGRLLKKLIPLKNGGVMVVAKDSTHQRELLEGCIEDININRKDIFVMEKGASINLTDTTVKEKKVRDYFVVIVTIRQAEGYNLSRLKAMVTSVYPSNEATRTQIEGRINRRGQTAKKLKYYVVQVGILNWIYQNHRDARNFAKILSQLADQIE